MSLVPATREALDLLMEGSLAFARMSEAGLRIDTAYLDKSIQEVKRQIAEMEQSLAQSDVYSLWRQHYGNNMKLDAAHQLGRVVFDLLGHKRNPHMDRVKGKYTNSEAAFEHLKVPFVKQHFAVKKLRKALTTNLLGIKREVVNGFVHPFYSLNTVESYRPSSNTPNFANQPIRNKIIAKIVRSCVIPRNGHVLLESDYSTQEVRTSYCYHKDPKLLFDILNGDMHKDRSQELFMLSDEELGIVNKDPAKLTRYIGKNKFVFAQFYGSYFAQCAPDLWDSISLYDLKTAQGVSLYDHLKSKGITKLGRCDPDFEPVEGTFEHHVMEVEHKMWKETYKVYDQWKRDWWELYQSQGGVNTLTGFLLKGLFRRNQILCDPIQGSAFHCLLWSLIQIQKEFLRRKMRSKVILQIYDSMLFDAHKRELDDVIEIVQKYALKKVAEHYKWICCPLSIEYELSESNWFEKQPMKVAA